MSDRKRADLRINLAVERGNTKPAFSINNLPASVFWEVYEAIGNAGDDGAIALAVMVAWVLKEGQPLTTDQSEFLSDFIEAIKEKGEHWKSREEFALSITYDALRERRIDHAQAASIASDILGKHHSTDAWRVKLFRWVEQQGRPRVGIRKRRTQ